MHKYLAIIGVSITVIGAYYLGSMNSGDKINVIEGLQKQSPAPQVDSLDLDQVKIKDSFTFSKKLSSSASVSPDTTQLVSELRDANQEEVINAQNSASPINGEGPMMVDPKSPLSYRYTFDQEKRLESWATPSESSLTESFAQHQFSYRYKLESVECKTTLCITKVSVRADSTNAQMENEFGWYGIVHSMKNSEVGQNLAEYETAVYVDKSDPPMIIYESTFIKQNR